MKDLQDLPSRDQDAVISTMEYLETKGFITYRRSGPDNHSQLSIRLSEQGKILVNDILAIGRDEDAIDIALTLDSIR